MLKHSWWSGASGVIGHVLSSGVQGQSPAGKYGGNEAPKADDVMYSECR